MLIFEKFRKISLFIRIFDKPQFLYKKNPHYSQIVENLDLSHTFWKISIFVKIFEKSQF